MVRVLTALTALTGALALPAALAGQTPPTSPSPLMLRGFAPGVPYREFAERARALARQDTLRCNTSRRTAQLMECGVMIRDPQDSARFYLSAYVLEGKVAVVSLYDSGGPGLVKRAQQDLSARFGPVQRRERSMWEWSQGRQFVRLNWRGRSDWRVVSITLNDRDVMDGISRYVQRTRAPR